MNVPGWVDGAPALVVAAVVLFGVTVRVAALGVIPGGRKPSVGMAWLLLVLLSPAVGLIGFLLFGRAEVGRRRNRRQERADEIVAERTSGMDLASVRPYDGGLVGTVVDLNRNLGAFPLLGSNGLQLYEDSVESVAAMAAAVDDAGSFVHVEFYITAWDDVTRPVYEALQRAARRGVEVRLLFDHLGSRGIPGYADMCRRLDAAGIRWQPMLPIRPLHGQVRRPDLRNHRKILVADGRVGFMGSLNLIEPGYGSPANHKIGREWVDLMARITGPTVTALDAVFATDWYQETGERLQVALPDSFPPDSGNGLLDVPMQLVPSGPGISGERNLRMFTSLIYAATNRISLTSPYFVPDESLLYAVTTAARRGVAVELFVSEVSDQFMVGHAQASYYRELLEAGVDIYLYPPPSVLHSKHFTVDDEVAVIGSSNMDIRSFALNYEVSLLMLGEQAVKEMRVVEDHYRSVSRPLTMEEWLRRPARTRYVDNVMRLTAALQ